MGKQEQRSDPSSARVSGFILPPINVQRSVFSSTASSVLIVPVHAADVLVKPSFCHESFQYYLYCCPFFYKKTDKNCKNAWFFFEKITLLGFSHASATSHFQWSGLSYVICNKKWTLLASVISQLFITFFYASWHLQFSLLNNNFHCSIKWTWRSIDHVCTWANILMADERFCVWNFQSIEYGVASTMSARGQTYWWRTWTRDRAGKFNQVNTA